MSLLKNLLILIVSFLILAKCDSDKDILFESSTLTFTHPAITYWSHILNMKGTSLADFREEIAQAAGDPYKLIKIANRNYGGKVLSIKDGFIVANFTITRDLLIKALKRDLEDVFPKNPVLQSTFYKLIVTTMKNDETYWKKIFEGHKIPLSELTSSQRSKRFIPNFPNIFQNYKQTNQTNLDLAGNSFRFLINYLTSITSSTKEVIEKFFEELVKFLKEIYQAISKFIILLLKRNNDEGNVQKKRRSISEKDYAYGNIYGETISEDKSFEIVIWPLEAISGMLFQPINRGLKIVLSIALHTFYPQVPTFIMRPVNRFLNRFIDLIIPCDLNCSSIFYF